MDDNDEIQRQKNEFFGYADDSQTNENPFPSNRNYQIEPTKECPFCHANISANAIFCVHCSRRIEASESTGNELSDITWGENGAVVNQLSSHSASYDETRSNQAQHGEKHYRCPRCRSESIQSFEMAYRSGTSRSSFSGAGYNFEVGSIDISGNSIQQTSLANLTSPPARPRPFLLGIIAVFVIPFFSVMPLLVAYLTSSSKFALILLIDVVLITVVFVVCGLFAPAQWKKYRQRYTEWENFWICLRCGHTFSMK